MAGEDEVFRRVPPQNIEAEQSVLGAILLDNSALNPAMEVLATEDFYRETHREIFKAMIALADRSQPIDAITLTEALRPDGVLEKCGGPSYIAELADGVPTASNIGYYARIVRQKALLRSVAYVAADISADAYTEAGDADEFLDQSEHRLFSLSDRRITGSFHDTPELTRASLRILENLYEKREVVTGVPTGFTDLDILTAGLQPSDLVVIAARPSMGKTALALNIAAHATMEAVPPRGVAFFTLEMSKEQIMLRLLCSEARIDLAKARAGYLAEADFPKLAAAAARISEAPIWFNDSSDTTVLSMKATCRRLAHEKGNNLGLIVADYIGLVRPVNPRDPREQQVAQISREMKALAKELGIPVLMLSQLNRQVEGRVERRPVLADLRESGAIEQDADLIAFIYREEMYRKKEDRASVEGKAEIIVAKQRNGPTDTVLLSYLKQYTRFENYADSERYDGR